jgi:hypothetical protein
MHTKFVPNPTAGLGLLDLCKMSSALLLLIPINIMFINILDIIRIINSIISSNILIIINTMNIINVIVTTIIIIIILVIIIIIILILTTTLFPLLATTGPASVPQMRRVSLGFHKLWHLFVLSLVLPNICNCKLQGLAIHVYKSVYL